jgi:magnesium transporter
MKINFISYNTDGCFEKTDILPDDIHRFMKPDSVNWIDIEGVDDTGGINTIGKFFGLHHLLLEDVQNTHHLPKIEEFDDKLFLIIRMMRPGARVTEPISEHLSVVLGQNFVITFQEGLEGDVFDPIRERLRSGKSSLLKKSADFLFYSIFDTIVDNYFNVVENYRLTIEHLEDKIVTRPEKSDLNRILEFKKRINTSRRYIFPLINRLEDLNKYSSDYIHPEQENYFNDIKDHLHQLIDTINMFEDMLSHLTDLYMSNLSNSMNNIMTTLTIVSVIFIPLTFLAGVYGMNFKYMPELEHPYGYFILLGVMFCIGIGMFIFIKMKKWI